MTIVVVTIPAYNEEKTVGNVISKVPQRLGDETKIVVVNDGSEDRTAEVAGKAGAKVITFKRNRGLAQAFGRALEEALMENADIIVNIDADGQYDPQEIEKLIDPILNHEADLVLGSRFEGYIESMNRMKRFGNILFTKLLRFLTHEDISDGQTGFRAFTREVAEALDIRGKYTYTQQMIIQASYNRFKIVEVPINFYDRKEGKSRLMTSPLQFAYRAMEILLLITVLYHPLKFFGITGVFFIFLGGFIGLTFGEWNVLASLTISTGIQFCLFGILFRIFKERF